MKILLLLSFFFVFGFSFAQRGRCGPEYCHPSCCRSCREDEACMPRRIPLTGLNPCTCEYRGAFRSSVAHRYQRPMHRFNPMGRWRIRPLFERRFIDPVGRPLQRRVSQLGLDPRMNPEFSLLRKNRQETRQNVDPFRVDNLRNRQETRQNVDPFKSDNLRTKESLSDSNGVKVIYGEMIPIYHFKSKKDKHSMLPLSSFGDLKNSVVADEIIKDPSMSFAPVRNSDSSGSLQSQTEKSSVSFLSTRRKPKRELRGSIQDGVGSNYNLQPEDGINRLPVHHSSRGGSFGGESIPFSSSSFSDLSRIDGPNIVHPEKPSDRRLEGIQRLTSFPDSSIGNVPQSDRSRGILLSPDRSLGMISPSDKSTRMISPSGSAIGTITPSDKSIGMTPLSGRSVGTTPPRMNSDAPSYVTKDVIYSPERYHDVNNIPFYDNQPYDHRPYSPEPRDPITQRDIMRMVSEGVGMHTNGLFDPRSQRPVPVSTPQHRSVAEDIQSQSQSPIVLSHDTQGNPNKGASVGQPYPSSDFKKNKERTASVNSLNNVNMNPPFPFTFPMQPMFDPRFQHPVPNSTPQHRPVSEDIKSQSKSPLGNVANAPGPDTQGNPNTGAPIGQSYPINDFKKDKERTASVNSLNDFNMHPPFPFMHPMQPMPPFPPQSPPKVKKSF